MNNQRGGGDHRWALLLIPAALIIAKGARHRRAMWEAGSGPSGASGYGHRHPGRFGGGIASAEDRVDARELARPCPSVGRHRGATAV